MAGLMRQVLVLLGIIVICVQCLWWTRPTVRVSLTEMWSELRHAGLHGQMSTVLWVSRAVESPLLKYGVL